MPVSGSDRYWRFNGESCLRLHELDELDSAEPILLAIILGEVAERICDDVLAAARATKACATGSAEFV